MSESVAVAVVCDHRGAGDLAEQDPAPLLTVLVTPGREPRGFLLTGRMVADGQRLDADSRARKWRAMWQAAHRNGDLPREVHELRCPACGFTRRTGDLALRRVLTRLAENGVHSVAIQSIPASL